MASSTTRWLEEVLAGLETMVAYGAPVLAVVIAVVLAGVGMVRRPRTIAPWHCVVAVALVPLVVLLVPSDFGAVLGGEERPFTWLFGARSEWVYGNARIATAVAAVLLLLVRGIRDEDDPAPAPALRPILLALACVAPVLGVALLVPYDWRLAVRIAPTVCTVLVAAWLLRGSVRKQRGLQGVFALCGVSQLAAVVEAWVSPFTSEVSPLPGDAVVPVLVAAALVSMPVLLRGRWAGWLVVLCMPLVFASWSGPAHPDLPHTDTPLYARRSGPPACVRPWPDHVRAMQKQSIRYEVDGLGWPERTPGRAISQACTLVVDRDLRIDALPWDWDVQATILTTAGPMSIRGGPRVQGKVEVDVEARGSNYVVRVGSRKVESTRQTLAADIERLSPDALYSVRMHPSDPEQWTIQAALDACDAVWPASCFWW